MGEEGEGSGVSAAMPRHRRGLARPEPLTYCEAPGHPQSSSSRRANADREISDRVKPFRKWAQEKMDNAQLSERYAARQQSLFDEEGRKWRLRRRKRRNRRGSKD